jgi:hypothetical protein
MVLGSRVDRSGHAREGAGERRAACVIAVALLVIGAVIGASSCGRAYDFEAVAIGNDEAGRVPKPRSNTQFVRAVYADLLGRSPELYDFVVEDGSGSPIITFPVDEQTVLIEAMESVADPDPVRAIVTAGLCASPESRLPEKSAVSDPKAFLIEQFKRFLGREPNAYELAAFLSEWESDPAVGPRTVVRALIGSREYQSQ